MTAKYLLNPGTLYFALGCFYYYLGSGGRQFTPNDTETPTRETVRAIFEQLKGVNLDNFAIDEIDKSEVRKAIADLEVKLIRVGVVERKVNALTNKPKELK